jgi:hypothetical protein
MKIFCKIGLHSWRWVGFTNLLLSDHLKICRRCGIGRHSLSYGASIAYYSAAQVSELERLAKCKLVG